MLTRIFLGIIFLCIALFGWTQNISKEEMIYLTANWKGERFSDGRPKISDELIVRARKIGI